MNPGHQLYITGGAVPSEALFYIARDADAILYEALQRGEFCYVLTPRQTGKSSLVAHTAQRLLEANVHVARIDLQNIGLNLTIEQWYLALLDKLGLDLRLQAELDAFELAHENISPLQLWQKALRDIVLPNIAGPIVIFLDEVDTVQGLSFLTDEFFGAIRACYNARAENPDFQRLTFCLLGVATPTDLIRNPRLTPFNIGCRIDLRDFTFEEAAQLQQGLGHVEGTNGLLMERIYYWTGGHPYLTQLLCKTVAENEAILTPKGVDDCCHQMFLAPTARQRDDHFFNVQARLLPENEDARAALLTLYQQVWNGRKVADNEATALIGPLKLSGVARANEGILIPRNPMYRQVFDSRWIREHMPDAELRRQRSAYWRGVLRTAMVSMFVLLLASMAVFQYLRAGEEQRQRVIEVTKERKEKKLLVYGYAVDHAQHALEQNDFLTAFKSLERLRPGGGEKDLRSFEWRYLWQKLQGDQHLFSCPDMSVFSIAVSLDGRFVAAGGQAKKGTTNTVRVWEMATQREIAAFSFPGEVNCLAFAPDNRTLAAGGAVPYAPLASGVVYLWDVMGPQLPPTLVTAPHGGVYALAFSHRGKGMAFAGAGGALHWWEINSHHVRDFPIKDSHTINSLAISGDDSTLALSREWRVEILNLPSGRSLHTNSDPSVEDVSSLAYSPDGRLLAAARRKGAVQLWEVKTWMIHRTLTHPAEVHAIAFSPNGKTLAAACWDGTIPSWDTATGQPLGILVGHMGLVNSVAFLPDGRSLVSGGSDGTVRSWETNPTYLPADMRMTGGPVCGLAFSEGGRTLATADGGRTVRLWDTASGRTLGTLATPRSDGKGARFPPDGRMLASESWRSWSAQTGSAEPLNDDTQTSRVSYCVTMQDLAVQHKIGDFGKYITVPLGAALSPDGDTVAVFGHDVERTKFGDGTLELWSRTQGFIGAVRGAHQNDILALAFSRDGKSIATGSWDRKVLIWDVTRLHGSLDGRPEQGTFKPIEKYRFNAQVFAIAFTKDKKTLAVGTLDQKISLCYRETGEAIAVLTGHTGAVTSLAFSPDDNLLVSGSLDGTIRFWRAATFTRTDDRVRTGLDALWKE